MARKYSSPPTRVPTEAELAWAAGFFDGEGSVGIYLYRTPRRRAFNLQMTVGQVDPRPLHVLLAIFGGRLEYEKRKPRRPLWRWTPGGREATGSSLRAMLPYLVVKREQALVVLAYLEASGPPDSSRSLTEAEQQTQAEFARRLVEMKRADGGVPWTQ